MSSELTALETHLADYERYFIVNKEDYASYTPEDHARALAYRVLSSAALERYVEDRCAGVAQLGINRLARSQPTTSGRALLTWYLVRKSPRRAIPVVHEELLQHLDLCDDALRAFVTYVKSSHGISGEDFKSLVLSVGLRDAQLPTGLVHQLDALAARRNPASHLYVNRAKTMEPPTAEVAIFSQILGDLRLVDSNLQLVAESFPVPE